MNQADKAVETFKKEGSLTAVVSELGISMHRARKLLSAKGIIINDKHAVILDLYRKGCSIDEISGKTGLSVSIVRSYLPPKRPLYKIDRSPNAVKIANWRKNKNK